MPVRSKWQSLPTEQINPATLAIDKLSPVDIVEQMLNEDRKMVSATLPNERVSFAGVSYEEMVKRARSLAPFRNFHTTPR